MTYVAQIRFVALALLVGIALATGVLMVIFDHGARSLQMMKSSREIIVAAEQMKARVLEAEAASLERAFVRTREHAARASERIAAARRSAETLRAMQTRSDSDAAHIRSAVRLAVANLDELNAVNALGADIARRQLAMSQRDFQAAELRFAVAELVNAESAMLQTARDKLERFYAIGRWLMIGLVLLAGVTIAIAICWVTHRMKSSIASLIAAMDSVCDDGVPRKIVHRAHGELGRMKNSFNAMIARLEQEIAARDEAEGRVTELLSQNGSALADRTRAMEILSRISNRLPACMDQKELIELAARFVPQLLPLSTGALYFLNNSQSVLRMVAQWGDERSLPEFAPSDCWALRRGQVHEVNDVETDVICQHVHSDGLKGFVCMPLVAQGEVVGLFFFERTDAIEGTARQMEDLRVLCENLALALVNLRLRESLRHQSLRDPLTGLYNRRYLEEAIELEFAKAERSDTPVSVIMADVDHFKKLNDTYGHDAGDLVLRQVAASFSAVIRRGDVACRYGGEEFLILLPGLDKEEAAARAEALRIAISALELRVGEQDVGKVTASFGVATMTGRQAELREIIKSADAALYEAKTSGRDRVAIHGFRKLQKIA